MKIYVDPKADAILPRWWHKLIFWKKWKYLDWYIRAERTSLKDLK